MSAKVKPFSRLERQVLHLQLLGEFDGSAACHDSYQFRLNKRECSSAMRQSGFI